MADGAGLSAALNGDCHTAEVDRLALERELCSHGETFFQHVTEHCPHLFAAAAFFVSASQAEQMRSVIAAVEAVVRLPGWQSRQASFSQVVPGNESGKAKGVFMGYDFHVNAEGAHLIEINTNAGGAYLSALLLDSQRDVALPGTSVASGKDLGRVFLNMFREEWRLERGDAPLQAIAIVDENPQTQYLYPEFLLAREAFERAGIKGFIAAPEELEARAEGLYCRAQKIDLVYNRLMDFALERHAALRKAYLSGSAVVTPNPGHYDCYADKCNLVALTDADFLRSFGVAEDHIGSSSASPFRPPSKAGLSCGTCRATPRAGNRR